PIQEAQPQSPGDDYSYAPGVWVWHDTRYMWRPGFWYPFRPGWVYIPAHYVWTPVGYVFVDGYWDYPLRPRGLLFSPVYCGSGFVVARTYVYRPTYIVYDDAIYGALFVRTGYRTYYYGDYFEARYTSFGYHSWIDIRIGAGRDPLWAYYSHTYRHDPTW